MPEENKIPTRDFLLEVGVEELPPKDLAKFSKAVETIFIEELKERELKYGEVRRFATPRRLGLLIRDLVERQPAKTQRLIGPSVSHAFDKNGAPTAAAIGFARSRGVRVDELETVVQKGIQRLSFTLSSESKATIDFLEEIANISLSWGGLHASKLKRYGSLPIPKRMRWGSSPIEFIRPVHWAVMLFGEEVVSASILGETTKNLTYGHRFHYNQCIELTCPGDYEAALEDPGHVIACFERRREMIRNLVTEQASRLKASATIDDALLDEVTSLVEFPVALTGEFDPEFLQLPKEVLILTLKHHQKCFCLEDKDGRLVPNFVTVSNIESLDPKEVIRGNERVIRPRLADARFFFETDKARSLESRLPELEKVVFQDKLGTIAAKSRRVAELSRQIADVLDVEPDACERAALLGKCDLVSDMVGEFAELQGIMGSYYARNDGEPETVATAIVEQYLPRYTGDRLPETAAGRVVALAEKLDTLAGLFAIGQPPTGSRDPFALRRAALGVLRILIEGGLELDLIAAIDAAVAAYAETKPAPDCRQQLYDFIFDRLRAWYVDAGTDAKIYLCVRALNPASPLDFHRRVEAVSDFAGRPEAAALAAANKRVSNLLDKSGEEARQNAVSADLLSETAEKQLLSRLQHQSDAVAPLFEAGNYQEGLTRLAGLRDDVDRFFDEVMVMVEDPAVRANRLRLLRDLRELFLQVADISLL